MRSILIRIADSILRAVVAPTRKGRVPSYRPLGKAITPYQYLTPIPVPVEDRRKKPR